MDDQQIEAIAGAAYEVACEAAEYYGDFNWLWLEMPEEPKAGLLAFTRAVLDQVPKSL